MKITKHINVILLFVLFIIISSGFTTLLFINNYFPINKTVYYESGAKRTFSINRYYYYVHKSYMYCDNEIVSDISNNYIIIINHPRSWNIKDNYHDIFKLNELNICRDILYDYEASYYLKCRAIQSIYIYKDSGKYAAIIYSMNYDSDLNVRTVAKLIFQKIYLSSPSIFSTENNELPQSDLFHKTDSENDDEKDGENENH